MIDKPGLLATATLALEDKAVYATLYAMFQEGNSIEVEAKDSFAISIPKFGEEILYEGLPLVLTKARRVKSSRRSHFDGIATDSKKRKRRTKRIERMERMRLYLYMSI